MDNLNTIDNAIRNWSGAICGVCGERQLGSHVCFGPQSVAPTYSVQRCPICEGRGHVPAGFYGMGVATDLNPETCQNCNGKGILLVSVFGVKQVT